jgi:hypothetical protein
MTDTDDSLIDKIRRDIAAIRESGTVPNALRVTVDTISDAVRGWLATHPKRPDHPIVIIDGRYDEGTNFAVGFQPPPANLVYRLQRDGVYAVTQFTEAAINNDDDGTLLRFIHRSTEQTLTRHAGTA